MKLGDVPVGKQFRFESGKEAEVIHQGESGTTIQPLARVAKTIHWKRNGQEGTTRISSRAKPTTISSSCEVTLL